MKKTFLLFFTSFALTLWGSEIPRFDDFSKSKDVVIFLSTPKSGINVMTASLTAITRKPISWLNWGNDVLKHVSKHRKHPSYNRLGLPLVSDKPLLYRSHFDFLEIKQFPSHLNKLVFVTRNPKELLYRRFLRLSPESDNPDPQFIETFLKWYLAPFEVYERWSPENRRMVFYEDFIVNGDEILLSLLEFMREKPTFLVDYQTKKQEYMNRLLESYKQQHVNNFGGSSSIGGPKAIHYSKNANPETLMYVDEYIKKYFPIIWEKYLKRFETICPDDDQQFHGYSSVK
jgi:hypothetical protein